MLLFDLLSTELLVQIYDYLDEIEYKRNFIESSNHLASILYKKLIDDEKNLIYNCVDAMCGERSNFNMWNDKQTEEVMLNMLRMGVEDDRYIINLKDACLNGFYKVAEYIIYTWYDYDNGALIMLCERDLEKLAIALVNKADKSDYVNDINKDGFTAFGIACNKGFNDLALAMINVWGEEITYIDEEKGSPVYGTELYESNASDAVVLAFLDKCGTFGEWDCIEWIIRSFCKTRMAVTYIDKKFYDKHYNIFLQKCSGDTTLMMVCKNGREQLALELIDLHGCELYPEHISSLGQTALTISCRNKLEKVAIKLLNVFGKDCLYQSDSNNPYNASDTAKKNDLHRITASCASDTAKKNGMYEVSEKIEQYLNN